MKSDGCELAISSKRVLAVAYACNPYRGSEHGVGWGWVKMIASSHQVDVIAAEFERQDVERWLAENPAYCSRMVFYYPEHKPWHYHKESKLWVWIEHSPLKIIMNWAYRLWQRDAYRLAKKLHRGNRFDLCHLITYVGFRFPGRFYQLDCPFVWGPVGALENTPIHFLPLLGISGAVYYLIRNLINSFDKRFLRHPKQAFRKASQTGSVIAATAGIQREIRKWYGVESHIICEIGPPLIDEKITPKSREPGDPLNICWSGTHTSGKALQLLLMALARLPTDVSWKLDVLGEGPCTERWKMLARNLGVIPNCTFQGKVPRADALKIMQQSHLLVITSLKDLTSSVLLEALNLGLPVVAPDHCGFSDVITKDCGISVPIKNIEQFIAGLGDAIRWMIHDELRRQRLAEGALNHIVDFNWDSKLKQLNLIYEDSVKKKHA